MTAEIDRCIFDSCQDVGGNWFMLVGGLIVCWLVYRYAP